MTHKYTDENIEQYILGTLPDSERIEFEKELRENVAFGQHVREQTLIAKAISDIDIDKNLSNAIKAAGAKYFVSATSVSTAKVRKIGWTKWAIAAAAGLLLLVAATFLLRMQSFDTEKVFAEYFEPGAMLEIDRSSDSLQRTFLSNAYKAYQQEDFKAAIEQFENDFNTNSATPRDLNYAGMAALALAEPDLDLAEEYFLKIIADGVNRYENSANWHLALISLKKQDEKEAITYLEKLAKGTSHKYTERSNELLKKLR